MNPRGRVPPPTTHCHGEDMRHPHTTGYSTATALPQSFDRKFRALILTALALCCALFAAPAHAGPFGNLFSKETVLEVKDGAVSLPVSDVSAKASFYKVKIDGTDVIFFALLFPRVLLNYHLSKVPFGTCTFFIGGSKNRVYSGCHTKSISPVLPCRFFPIMTVVCVSVSFSL